MKDFIIIVHYCVWSCVLVAALTIGVCVDPTPSFADMRPFVEDIIPIPEQVSVSAGVANLPNGAGLWYWDTGGDGEVIVLAHPHSGNHKTWMYQQPVFFKAGYRVIGYSRRGYYQSESGPENDVGSQAKDLALLLDYLGIDKKVHVLGAAAGGSTALDFALSYPERTRSAAVMSSILSIQEPEYIDAMKSARGKWFNGLDVTYRETSSSFRVIYPGGVKMWREIYDLNPSAHDAKKRVRQPTTTKITWDVLAKNKVPLLLTTGGADIYQPPELLLRVSERIPAAEVHIFANAGHPVFAEQPDNFNNVVLNFFSRY